MEQKREVVEERWKSAYSRSSGEKTREKRGGRRETRKRVGKRKRWENGRGELLEGEGELGRMIVRRERWRSDEEEVEESTEEYYGRASNGKEIREKKKQRRRKKIKGGVRGDDGGGGGGQRDGGWIEGEEEEGGIGIWRERGKQEPGEESVDEERRTKDRVSSACSTARAI